MKIRTKAPWYKEDPKEQEVVDQVQEGLGLCYGCIRTRISGPTLPDGKPGIEVTCSHPERQGPGKGLSTREPCPYKLEVTSKDKELEKLYKKPLEMCPDCSGTGSWKGGISPESESRPCPRCFGTGALTPLG